MATTPSITCSHKKHWWLTNRKIVDRYLKEARVLVSSRDHSEITAGLSLVEAALSLLPKLEPALELKARALLHLRRFKDVADMLQDYIPSLKMVNEDLSASSLSSESSSQLLPKEKVTSSPEREREEVPVFKCFSMSYLKKRVVAGIFKSCEKEGQWRYLVLGQACSHLGLMEDAMLLLQTGKRLATDAFRRESICWSDDSFSFVTDPTTNFTNSPPPRSELDDITHILCHIKLLLRRKTAALAALDAGLHSESIRHFSKILDGRRGAPQGFLSECYMHRALAYKSSGRIAESIADCNHTLALNPSCIEALTTRATLFETIRCLPDSLHDLEHLKLLYNSILRDRKLPGPAWKKHNVRYREIPGKLCALGLKIQELKERVGAGETANIDNYALIGLRRGCSKSELERAHLLLMLRHKPDKITSFIDRCDFGNDRDVDLVRDSAKMSALVLYRLIQKGHMSLMQTVVEEQVAEEQRKKVTAELQVAAVQAQQQQLCYEQEQFKLENEINRIENEVNSNANSGSGSVFQGVFCRDIAAVGSLLSQVGFNRPISVKYEALTC